MKKYRIGFNLSCVVLFLLIMVPNFFWFAIPAPNDILRQESLTPQTDLAASVCQVMMVAVLCVLVNRTSGKFHFKRNWIIISGISCLCYYIGWILYYQGFINTAVILLLTLFPCFSFLFYAIDRKNWPGVLVTLMFSLLHFIYAVINFIV